MSVRPIRVGLLLQWGGRRNGHDPCAVDAYPYLLARDNNMSAKLSNFFLIIKERNKLIYLNLNYPLLFNMLIASLLTVVSDWEIVLFILDALFFINGGS